MTTVTHRIQQTHQPHGGYIPVRSMAVTQYEDGHALRPAENLPSGLVGTAVDYLTRVVIGTPRESAFEFALRGASALREWRTALALLDNVVGLNYPSVAATCQLAAYDTAYRAGAKAYRAADQPDRATYENICIMVTRARALFSAYWPVTMVGFRFPGGYTDVVSAGDGDFLTRDTLWDFKVSATGPTKNHTLQLLMYYLMGLQSGQPQFTTITHLGIFNPRMNKTWRIAVAAIAPEIVDEVARDVIGYSSPVCARQARVTRRSWRTLT